VKTVEAARELARSAPVRFEGDAARLALRALSDAPAWPLERIDLAPL
jgi:hypothetical protein